MAKSKGSERWGGDGGGLGRKAGNGVEGASGASGWQRSACTTGGGRVEGGAVSATAGAMSEPTVVDRPKFTTWTTAALRPAVAPRTVGVPRTGRPAIRTSVTGVPAAVPRASVPVASTAASGPAAATAVPRSGAGPCPVAQLMKLYDSIRRFGCLRSGGANKF